MVLRFIGLSIIAETLLVAARKDNVINKTSMEYDALSIY
jgi:hypothetical protein